MLPLTRSGIVRYICAIVALLMAFIATAFPAKSEVTAFKQAVAEAAALDRDLAEFYRESGYAPIWTDETPQHLARR